MNLSLDKIALFLMVIGALGPAGSARYRQEALNNALTVLLTRSKMAEERRRWEEKMGLERERIELMREDRRLRERRLELLEEGLRAEQERLRRQEEAYAKIISGIIGEQPSSPAGESPFFSVPSLPIEEYFRLPDLGGEDDARNEY